MNAYKEYSKPLELKVQSADVVSLVARILDLFTPDLHQYCIKSTFSYQSKAMEAEMDIALMEQVIINLLKNAMDAVAHDGTGVIKIDIRRKATQHMALSISDNGGGMDSETLRKIFIPFFTTKTKGTGIGLSLSRQIVKMHNGNILVKSELGKGSKFTMEWR